MSSRILILFIFTFSIAGCIGQYKNSKNKEMFTRYQLLEKFKFKPSATDVDSEAIIGDITINLVGPDNPKNPTAWEGPLLYNHKLGKNCDVDLGIISAVYSLNNGTLLMVMTYSGSATFVTFVDPKACEIVSFGDQYLLPEDTVPYYDF